MTEDAARIITKRYKRHRFGDLVNRSKSARTEIIRIPITTYVTVNKI